MKVAILVFLAAALGGLNEESFEQLHRDLQPPENEVWRSIPWQVSLLDAQAMAAKEQKPLFIWAMDGHPLGCT